MSNNPSAVAGFRRTLLLKQQNSAQRSEPGILDWTDEEGRPLQEALLVIWRTQLTEAQTSGTLRRPAAGGLPNRKQLMAVAHLSATSPKRSYSPRDHSDAPSQARAAESPRHQHAYTPDERSEPSRPGELHRSVQPEQGSRARPVRGLPSTAAGKQATGISTPRRRSVTCRE